MIYSTLPYVYIKCHFFRKLSHEHTDTHTADRLLDPDSGISMYSVHTYTHTFITRTVVDKRPESEVHAEYIVTHGHTWLFGRDISLMLSMQRCVTVRSVSGRKLSAWASSDYTIYSGQSNLTKGPYRRRTWTVQSYSPGCANVHPLLIMLSWTHPSPHTKRHLDRFSRFAQLTANSPYTLQWIVRTFPPQNWSFAWGSGHGFLGPPESTTQTASRSVQPLLQGSRSWQTDRPRYSVCNNRPHPLRCGLIMYTTFMLFSP